MVRDPRTTSERTGRVALRHGPGTSLRWLLGQDAAVTSRPASSGFTGTVITSGVVSGLALAVVPLLQPVIGPPVVFALCVGGIATIYVGFAVADGRPRVIAVEAVVALAFLVLGVVSLATTTWLLPALLVAHGFKDLLQHRTCFVAGTRWWAPYCAVTDWVAAVLVVLVLVVAPTRFDVGFATP